MADNTVQTGGGGGDGASTALLAILVIAVIAFGIWFIMRSQSAPAQENTEGKVLDIEVGGGQGGNQQGGGSSRY